MIPVIYLDNAASTKVTPEVMDAMRPYFYEVYGNPGSIHSIGREARKAIEGARRQVAAPIKADPDKIIFTGGGSEANTLAIIGLSEHLKSIGKTHIITTKVEHHSVLECMKSLFYKGFQITYLPVNGQGDLDLDLLSASICDKTGLVSIMTINNETGNLYPIHEIGEICRQNGILFHTDCVQGYCQTNIDVEKNCIDFLSASGHKIHAPKGIGFLYAGNADLLKPVVMGGGQERGLRGGTENVPNIVGFGAAAENAYLSIKWSGARNQRIILRFLIRLAQNLGRVTINGNRCSSSKIVNLQFEGVDGESLLLLLDSRGIAVSAGSACSAHSAVPSHVLTAMGLTDEAARSSIRVSVSEYTTDAEMNAAADVIADSVKHLRGE